MPATAISWRKGPFVPIEQEAGWPQSRSFYRRQRSLASAGIRTTDHPVHSLFTILCYPKSPSSLLHPNIPLCTAFSKALNSLSIISFVSFNHHYIPSNEHHIAGHWTYLYHQVKGKDTHIYSNGCDRRA